MHMFLIIKAFRSTPFGNFASFPTAIMNSAVGIGSRIKEMYTLNLQ